MVSVFIDTNIWITYLTGRDDDKFKDTCNLINLINQGKITPYISNIILLEIFFVMTSLYKFDKNDILSDIKKLTTLRNLVIIDKTKTPLALKYTKKYNLKLSDCFLATQIPKDTPICTFDHDFKKIKNIKVISPKDILDISHLSK